MKTFALILAFAVFSASAQKPLKKLKQAGAYIAASPGAGPLPEAAPQRHPQPQPQQHYHQGPVNHHHGGGGGFNSPQGQKPSYPLLLADTRTLNSDGTINFNYQADNGLQQGETVDADGTRRGFYSYPGADGKLITVKYTAGKNGFVAEGDHLPTQPQSAPYNPKQEEQDAIYNSRPSGRQHHHQAQPQHHHQAAPIHIGGGHHGGAYRPQGLGGHANLYSHNPVSNHHGGGGGGSASFANFPDFSSQFSPSYGGKHVQQHVQQHAASSSTLGSSESREAPQVVGHSTSSQYIHYSAQPQPRQNSNENINSSPESSNQESYERPDSSETPLLRQTPASVEHTITHHYQLTQAQAQIQAQPTQTQTQTQAQAQLNSQEIQIPHSQIQSHHHQYQLPQLQPQARTLPAQAHAQPQIQQSQTQHLQIPQIPQFQSQEQSQNSYETSAAAIIGGAGRHHGGGHGGHRISGHPGGSQSFSSLQGLGGPVGAAPVHHGGHHGGHHQGIAHHGGSAGLADLGSLGSSLGNAYSGPMFTASNPYQHSHSGPVNAGFDLGNGGHFSINFTPGTGTEYNPNELNGDYTHAGGQQGAGGHGGQGRY